MESNTTFNDFYLSSPINPDLDGFRHLIETMPLVVWITSANGDLEYISPWWGEFTGLTLEDEGYLNWLMILHPDDATRAMVKWKESITTGCNYDERYRFRAKSGEYKWLRAEAKPVRNKEGEIIRWYGVSGDIDEEVINGLQLSKASQEKDNFIAMLSHELRNPLGAIMNAYNIMTSENTTGKHKEESLQILGNQIQHLKRLVDDTLDVSRFKFGKFKLIKQNTDICKLLSESFSSLEPEMTSKNINYKLIVPDVAIWVYGDAVRLHQCFINIIGNAVKFSSPQDEITVKISEGAGGIKIQISDTGAGINQQDLEILFESFQQCKNADGSSNQGLGLGLAVVRQIVEMHEGTVYAESEGVGRGATFTIEIPVIELTEEDQEADIIHKQIVSSREADVKPALQVLIIEDKVSLSRTLQILIEVEGHHVLLADEAEAALSMLDDWIPDLIISDLTIPGIMDGWQLVEQIRQSIPEDKLPYMVALSGLAQPSDIQRSLDAGFHKHLAKPINSQEILTCLESAYLFKSE